MGYDLDSGSERLIQSHAKAIDLHPDFDLIGAVEVSSVLREVFTKKYHKPAYVDLQTALADLTPDLFIVAVPTMFHFSIVNEIIRLARPVAILCEKPLSYDLDEARLMIKLCEDAGIKLIVNYIRRSEPGALQIKRDLSSGKIQGPIKGVCYYSKGFLHNGSHFFNLLQFWLGDVKSYKVLNKGQKLDTNDAEPDIFVSFNNGDVIFLSTWDDTYSDHSIEFVSPSGKLSYQKGGSFINWFNLEGGVERLEIIPNEIYKYQWNVLNNLSKMLSGHKDFFLCDGCEALGTLIVMNKIINE